MGKKNKKSVQFEYPKGNFPRLCLIGNSNVGKSSLTRLLLSNPQWYKGKIGKTAGSTFRLMIINDPKLPYQVIDLPGFGHMSTVRRYERDLVMDQILDYLEKDYSNIFLTLMVIALDRLDEELEKWYYRNPETIPLSIEFIQFVVDLNIPCIIILNKEDKINKYQKDSVIKKFRRVLSDFSINCSLTNPKSNELELILTSTKTINHEGIKKLKARIRDYANLIDFSKYDPRKELYKKPKVNQNKKK